MAHAPLEYAPAGIPRLKDTTAGRTAFAVTHSRPAITSDTTPLPWQSSTRTATSVAPLATPIVRPMAIEAVAVPWPLQSAACQGVQWQYLMTPFLHECIMK